MGKYDQKINYIYKFIRLENTTIIHKKNARRLNLWFGNSPQTYF